MVDNVQIRFWSRLLSLPIVWVPVTIGLCLTISGYGAKMFVGGTAVSCCTLALVWFFQRDRIWKQAKENFRLETRYLQQAELRQLRRQLRRDNDYRSSQCIRDLQDLYDRMYENDLLANSKDSDVGDDIKRQTWQLFETGKKALHRSYELWQAAEQMTSEQNRNEILHTREGLLDELSESLTNLGHAIDFLQTSRIKKRQENTRSINQAGSELARGLEVAKAVQRRLDELEDEMRISE